jgi:hypothetical protein
MTKAVDNHMTKLETRGTNMRRRMKRHWLLAASLVLATPVLTTPASLNAEPYILKPIDQEEKPGRCNSEVFAEAIYWAPNPLEFNYAQVGTINPADLFEFNAIFEDLTSEILDPGYDWGFRFGYRMNRDRWFARGDFLWIEMENSDSARRGAGDNSMTIPNLQFDAGQVIGFRVAHANSNTQYENASLQVGYRGCDTCRGWWETFAVAEAFYFRFRARVSGEGEATIGTDPVTVPIYGIFTQGFEQVGLGLGSGLRFSANVGCGLHFGGEFEAFGSVSRVKGIEETNSLTPAQVQGLADPGYLDQRLPTVFNSHDCFALGFKTKIGVDYSRCCSCYELTARVGYEVQAVKIGIVGGPVVGLGVAY